MIGGQIACVVDRLIASGGHDLVPAFRAAFCVAELLRGFYADQFKLFGVARAFSRFADCLASRMKQSRL